MIVIVIIGMLAGVVSLNVRGYLNKARKSTARNEIATVMHAMEMFQAANGRYPTTDEGITILTKPSVKCPEKLIDKLPIDPWGNAYVYKYNGATADPPYEIVCYGSDGKEGGEGPESDISSTDLKEK